MIQTLQVRSSKQTELIDITRPVAEAIQKTGVKEGLCMIFTPHTTAAVTINENADPSVPKDILMELNKIVPFEDRYQHPEGNSAAHIKSSLVGCSRVELSRMFADPVHRIRKTPPRDLAGDLLLRIRWAEKPAGSCESGKRIE